MLLLLFNQRGELNSPIICNDNVWRGAANSHRGGRGVDLHTAGLCYLAGDKGEGAFDETVET